VGATWDGLERLGFPIDSCLMWMQRSSVISSSLRVEDAHTSSVVAQTPSAAIRVAIFQPSLPHYRVPVFAELAGRDGIDLTLHYSTRSDIQNVEPRGFKACHSLPTFNVMQSSFVWNQHHIEVAMSREYDVLVFPWTPRILSLLPASVLARRAGSGIVMWGQGVSKNESRTRLALRNWFARRGDTVVTYNHAVARGLVQGGLPASDVFTAINSLDQSDISHWRDKLASQPERLYRFKESNRLTNRTVLYVSRLHHPNRVDVLIEAAAKLARHMPELRVILVGSGDARDSLEALVRKLQLESVVTFTGALYGEEQTAPWFAASDVFCYPSNSGLSLLHAQGYGLPLLVGDKLSAHNPEIESFQEGVNGRSFRHNDPTDLAAVLNDMLNDRAGLANMGQAGRRNVAERFTISRMVDGLEGAIRRANEKRLERLHLRSR